MALLRICFKFVFLDFGCKLPHLLHKKIDQHLSIVSQHITDQELLFTIVSFNLNVSVMAVIPVLLPIE